MRDVLADRCAALALPPNWMKWPRNSHLFFVMEYLTGGDLMFHIQHSGRFDEYRACFYSAEICSGLRFLHNKGIIYRDLKLDNILLDFEGHIRIADFGMCKLQIYLDKFADTFCGTPDYMAPEVIKGQHYNQCVDWWSFGVLLYEMMVGKSPFKGCDEDHLFWLICNEEPFYPRFLTIQAQSILKQLLDKDCTKRLGIPYSPYGDIQCHPFYKYVDWSKIERKEVETPYKPKLRHILDVQFFDPLFTKRSAALTPIDDSILSSMDQTPFKDFSYTNPNITE
ncbi:Protein kinase C-terminal [Trinorchestia longiramus]|nr:Protein kinase C-terminal [Trinorchestia longiramus]